MTMAPACDTVNLEPDSSVTRLFQCDDGQLVEVAVPAGAVTQTTQLDYSTFGVERPSSPRFKLANFVFALDAHPNGQPDCLLAFSTPVSLTVTYQDADIVNMDESRLVLLHFDEKTGAWIDDGITVLSHDLTLNQIVVQITRLAVFAVGERAHDVYLPMVGGNGAPP